MAENITQLYHRMRAFVIRDIRSAMAGSSATGGLSATVVEGHSHDDRYFTESESETRYLNASGDTLTGNLSVDPGVTVDGVDISAHAAATGTSVHGLGTMSTQSAAAVEITGGEITGIVDLTVADGGTGASTAAGARTNLGLVIGTDVQAWDADLDALAALSKADSNFIVGNGSAWVAESGATVRTSLGLGTGDSPQFTRLGLGVAADGSYSLKTAGDVQIGGSAFLGATSESIESSSFTSGFSGNGFRLDDSLFESGKTALEVDNLTVRGRMRVYELLIQQIRATNGSVFVSSTGKVESVSDLGGGSYGITTDAVHGFAVDDLIRAQRFTGTGVYQSDMTVTAVGSTTTFTATLEGGADAPEAGMEFVRLGSTSDTDRQGSVYLSADDTYAPYIDILDGVSAFGEWATMDTIKVRLGRLEGITDTDLNPTGYGLYSENAYLKGSLIAGLVTLDGTGAKIVADASTWDAQSAVRFVNASDEELGGLYGYYTTSTSNVIGLRALSTATERPYAYLLSQGTGTGTPSAGVVYIAATNADAGNTASITLDSSASESFISLGAADVVYVTPPLVASQVVRPSGDTTSDLGTASYRWGTLYVDQIVATTLSGDTLGGAEWEYAGSIIIDANSASSTTVSITNQGAGTASLDVEGSITVGGTVDGVDIALHASSTAQHGATGAVVGTTNTQTLSNKTLTDPTISATGWANANHTHAGASSGGQIAHSDLTSIGTNTHAQIDTHIANTSNPHSVTPAQLSLVIGTNVQAWDADLDAIAALAKTDSNFIVGNGTTWVAESGATVRASLGLVIGTNVQAWDADLDAIAALTKTDSNFIVGNGTTWVVESGATVRASLGLIIGTNVQAWDADLDAIAALAKTDSNFIVGNGTTWVAESGATVRTSLGLGTGDSPQFTRLGLGVAADGSYSLTTAGDVQIGGSAFLGATGEAFESSSFVSGWAGSGFRLEDGIAAGGTTLLEVDEITVRGRMHVYELLVQQLRSTNGSVLVSSTGKADTVTGSGPYTITTATDHGFAVNDLIIAQRFTGTGTYTTRMTVTAVGSSTAFTATLKSGDDAPVVGAEFMRVGSTSDTDRQGSIYLTADDTYAPYIDIIDDVAAWTDWGDTTNTKARLGRLDGITDADMGALSGYGLYSNNAYLRGSLVSGGGIVILDDDGIAVDTPTTWTDANGYRFSLSGTTHSGLWSSYYTGSYIYTRLTSNVDATGNIAIADKNASLLLNSQVSGASYISDVQIRANHASFGPAIITLTATNTWSQVDISGTNVNLVGDIAVNTDDLVVDASSGHVQMGTTTDSAQLTVKAGSASTIGLVVDSAASPTANIAEFANDGTTSLSVGTGGQVQWLADTVFVVGGGGNAISASSSVVTMTMTNNTAVVVELFMMERNTGSTAVGAQYMTRGYFVATKNNSGTYALSSVTMDITLNRKFRVAVSSSVQFYITDASGTDVAVGASASFLLRVVSSDLNHDYPPVIVFN